MDGIKKWLEDNPVGIALGALCGFFLLVLLALTVLSSLPLSTYSEEAEGVDNSVLELPTLADSQPIDTYSVITERPLFNESRQPILDSDSLADDIPLELDDAVGKPEVELSGVVITPTLRIAMLKRKDDATSLVAFEGMPIEADFGNWHVSEVQKRSAILKSGSGEELHLEMKVHDAKIEQPDPPPQAASETVASSASAPSTASAADRPDGQPLSRAEEIRQRIAERREELRREAEEAGVNNDPNDANNYQDAIQSMMSRGRREDPNNDNEQ